MAPTKQINAYLFSDEQRSHIFLDSISPVLKINLRFIKDGEKVMKKQQAPSATQYASNHFPSFTAYTYQNIMKIVQTSACKLQAEIQATHGVCKVSAVCACAVLSMWMHGCVCVAIFCLKLLSLLSNHLSHRSKSDTLQDPSPTDSQQIPD